MKLKFLLALFLLLGLSNTAQAQNSYTLAWEYNVPVATVNTYSQVVFVNSVVQIGPINCVAKLGDATKTSCSKPVNDIISTGGNFIEITATVNNVTAATRIIGLTTTNSPQNPVNPNIRIQIDIKVP